MHTLTHAPYGRWRVLSLLSAYLNSWRVHGSVYMCSTSAGLKAMLYTFQHVLLSQLWGRLWESCLLTMVDQAIFYLKMRTISFSLYSQNPEIVLLSFMMLYKKGLFFLFFKYYHITSLKKIPRQTKKEITIQNTVKTKL